MNSLTDLKPKCSKCKNKWTITINDYKKSGDVYKTCSRCRDELKYYYDENKLEIREYRIEKKRLEDERKRIEGGGFRNKPKGYYNML